MSHGHLCYMGSNYFNPIKLFSDLAKFLDSFSKIILSTFICFLFLKSYLISFLKKKRNGITFFISLDKKVIHIYVTIINNSRIINKLA